MDIITYGKSKTYTNQTAEEFGGLKGANCTIKSITPISGGNRVTFEWKNTEGATQEGTLDVMDGVDGNDGLGIKSVTINASNHLIITYDDDTTEDAGEVQTVQGEDGKSAYEIAVEHGYSGTEEEWLASLKGDDGEGVPTGGTTGQVLVKKSSTDYDTEWGTPAGGGDMLKSVYDTDNDGKVDSAENADTVDGHTVAKDVPADAEFTDTVYDDTEIRGDIADKVDKVTGKGLSTNDYSDADKTIVDGVTSALAEKADVADIPSKTSDLTNDSGFITKAVNDLVSYYLKSETYSKTEVDDIVTAIKNSRFEVVATLPTTDIKTNVIYLVPKSPSQTSNVKDEYINLDGTTSGWEKIGDTEIDLSDYVTTQVLNTALANYTTTADLTTLLAAKQDTLTFDNVPTENSNNPVKSGGVYSANQTLTNAFTKQSTVNGAVNELDHTGVTDTSGTVKFTVNEDKSITVSADSYPVTLDSTITFFFFGTNSAAVSNIFKGKKLTGCPSGDTSGKVKIAIQGFSSATPSSGTDYSDTGNGVILGNENYIRMYIRLGSGYQLTSALTFKPMISLPELGLSYADYVPYAKTNQELTAENQTLTNQVKDMNNILGAKNLLPFNLADIIANNTNGTWSGNTYTRNGVAFTVNDDGTVTANGTATDLVGLEFFGTSNSFKTNNFKGCILTGGLSSNARVVVQGADSVTGGNVENYNDLGNGVQIGSKDYIRLYLRVASGATVSNVVFKPMIRLASDTDDTYEPYAKTNRELTGYADNMEVNGAVNMLPNNGTSQTINEVTFTVNPDKSITAVVASTPSSARYFDIYNFDESYPHIGETLKLSGCPKNGGGDTYTLLVNNASVGIGASDYGDGKIFLFDNDGTTTPAKARIKIGTSCPAGTYVFKPMITVPSYKGDYVPYAKSNKELTDDVEELSTNATKVVTLPSDVSIFDILTDESTYPVKNTYWKRAQDITNGSDTLPTLLGVRNDAILRIDKYSKYYIGIEINDSSSGLLLTAWGNNSTTILKFVKIDTSTSPYVSQVTINKATT